MHVIERPPKLAHTLPRYRRLILVSSIAPTPQNIRTLYSHLSSAEVCGGVLE